MKRTPSYLKAEISVKAMADLRIYDTATYSGGRRMVLAFTRDGRDLDTDRYFHAVLLEFSARDVARLIFPAGSQARARAGARIAYVALVCREAAASEIARGVAEPAHA